MYQHAYAGLNLTPTLGTPEPIDIPGGVYSDLVNYWYSLPVITGGRDKGELRTVAEMLLPVYVYGRLYDGIPAPVLRNGVYWFASDNTDLVSYMEQRSGVFGEVIRDFLHMLYNAVQDGIVPANVLEPATWEDVAPPSAWDKFSPAVSSVADFYGSQFTKVLVAGALVAAIIGVAYVAVKK